MTKKRFVISMNLHSVNKMPDNIAFKKYLYIKQWVVISFTFLK